MTEPVDFSACERLQGLTDLQRQFYKTYLAARYEVLLGDKESHQRADG